MMLGHSSQDASSILMSKRCGISTRRCSAASSRPSRSLRFPVSTGLQDRPDDCYGTAVALSLREGRGTAAVTRRSFGILARQKRAFKRCNRGVQADELSRIWIGGERWLHNPAGQLQPRIGVRNEKLEPKVSDAK